MIDFRIDLDLPVPYVAVRIGQDIGVLENPGRYGHMPHWLRQMHLNDALRRLAGPPPRKTVTPRPVETRVVDLAAYRALRTGS